MTMITAMGMTTGMTTEPRPAPAAALMTLVQWLSPAFPVGGYAYSHGLEQAIASGRLRGAQALGDWLADVIALGSGRVDADLLALALRPGADHAALADLAEALAGSKERAAETLDQGRAFTLASNPLIGAEHPPAALPVAVGRAAAPLGLPAEQVIGLYLQSFASTLVQGAVRFMPLGQAEGQACLARLQPVLLATAARAARTEDPATLASAGFGSEMAAMAHETLEVRIFRS